jgi:hypothetical protein
MELKESYYVAMAEAVAHYFCGVQDNQPCLAGANVVMKIQGYQRFGERSACT